MSDSSDSSSMSPPPAKMPASGKRRASNIVSPSPKKASAGRCPTAPANQVYRYNVAALPNVATSPNVAMPPEDVSSLDDFDIKLHGPDVATHWHPVSGWINKQASWKHVVGNGFVFEKDGALSCYAEYDDGQFINEEEEDDFDVAGEVHGRLSNFSPSVDEVFGIALRELETFELSYQSQMRSVLNSQPGRPVSVIGTPQLMASDRIACVNPVRKTLVQNIGNRKNMNQSYFMKAIQHRTSRDSDGNSKNIQYLKLAIAVPDFGFTEFENNSIRTFYEECEGNIKSPYLFGAKSDMKWLRGCFWNAYAYVIAKYYQMPIVGVAVCNGWKPLFLFKNLCAQKGLGTNHFHLPYRILERKPCKAPHRRSSERRQYISHFAHAGLQ